MHVYTHMQNRILAATSFLTLTCVLCYAQGTAPTPPTPAQIVSHQVARLTKLLDLTTTQQAQATTIFTTEQTTLETVRTSMHTAHATLETAIKANDAAGISTQAAAIGTFTAQEVQAQGTADAAFFAILTADQQSKYDTLGPRGPGGRGGPGGPGPHGFGGSH